MRDKVKVIYIDDTRAEVFVNGTKINEVTRIDYSHDAGCVPTLRLELTYYFAGQDITIIKEPNAQCKQS